MPLTSEIPQTAWCIELKIYLIKYKENYKLMIQTNNNTLNDMS